MGIKQMTSDDLAFKQSMARIRLLFQATSAELAEFENIIRLLSYIIPLSLSDCANAVIDVFDRPCPDVAKASQCMRAVMQKLETDRAGRG